MMLQGWLPVPDPVAFSVFGFEIMWYAIMLTSGIIAAFAVVWFRAKSRNLDPDMVYDFAIVGIPFGMIGARLYYVIFEWENYRNNLAEIFNIRGGGLAIHGAVIGGFGSVVIYLLIKKQKPVDWMDLAFIGLPLGQAIGRWGNYFNSEAHGGPTDLPWAIYADGEWVHPTFLYESIWCFLLFLLLLYLDVKKPGFKGRNICIYMVLYGIERFFVEGLRTDSLYIGSFKQAQVISVFTIVMGIVLWFVFRKNCAGGKTTAEELEKSDLNKSDETEE